MSDTVDTFWWLGFWPTGEHVYWWATVVSHTVGVTDLRAILEDAAAPHVWASLAQPPTQDGDARSVPAVVAHGSVPLAALQPLLDELAAALPGLPEHVRHGVARSDARIAAERGSGSSPDPYDRFADALDPRVQERNRRVKKWLYSSTKRAWQGPLVEPEANLALCRRLGDLLLPAVLRDYVGAQASSHRGHGRTTVVVATGPLLAAVPWELLVVDGDDLRLVETAHVRGALSPAVLADLAVVPGVDAAGGATLRVLDPGRSPASALDGAHDERWAARTRSDAGDLTVHADPTRPCTPKAFSRLLRSGDWARLLFYGHAVSGDVLDPTASALEFAVDAGDRTLAQPGALSARDWLKTPTAWPAPRRVAFIACEADDSRYLEQLGLTLAAVNAGARVVTTTRWLVPTDSSVGLVDSSFGLDDGSATHHATTGLALAVDAAHAAPDPVDELRVWQLDMLRRWRTALDARDRRRHAPLVWASTVTYVVPDAAVGSTRTSDRRD